jgi:hypothetical protein
MMDKEEKKECVLTLLDELEEKIGEALNIYNEVEENGFSDHYLKQELDSNFMDSVPEKIQKLRDEIEEGDDDE